MEAITTSNLNAWQIIADAMPQKVWSALPNGEKNFCNHSYKEYTGLTEKEINGTGWLNIIHPDDRQRVQQAWTHAIQTGQPYEAEYRFRRHDGAYRWFLAQATPLKEANGQILAWLGCSTDIHEQKQAADEMDQKDRRYGLIVQATQDVVWDWDLRTNEIWRNERYKHMYGFSEEEKGTHIDSFISRLHPDDRDRVLAVIQEALEKGLKNGATEYRHLRKDGTYATVIDRAFALYDDKGIPYRMLGSTQDITERKKQEELLAQKDRYIRNLIQHASVGIMVCKGKDMTLEIVNKNMYQFLEKKKDIIGKPLITAIPALNGHYLLDALYNVYQAGQPFYGNEQPIIEKGNAATAQRYFNLAFTPVIEGNTIEGVMIMATEVTAQVRARKTLEETHKELQFVMDVMPAMVWHTQPDGAADFFNKAYINYTGRSMQQLTGFKYKELLHPDDLEELQQVLGQAFTHCTEFKIEHRLLGKEGTYHWFLSRAVPLKNEGGKIIKWYGSTIDIQDQKSAAELLELRVQERTRELESRTKELEQFTFVSHHDLQEPLRKILTFSDRIQHESAHLLTENARLSLDRMTQSARRMKAVLADVLDFARLNKEEQLESVDLNETLVSVQWDLELLIMEKSATIYIEELPTITAIPTQLHQLFYNLLNNSLKYAKEGQPPLITVTCRTASPAELKQHTSLDPHKDYYEITVTDNGIGFDQEYADKIFEIFQRLHTKSAYEGTGIGLALCRKIVQNHKGHISAEGKESIGATFKILLPAE